MRVFAETTRTREDEQLTPEKIRSYELALAGIKPESLELGMRSLLKRAIWFPTAAEIREACMEAANFKRMQDETKERLALPPKPPGWISLAEVVESSEFKAALSKTRMPAAAPIASRRVIVPLTEEQHKVRIEELQRQKRQLGL